MKPVMFGMVSLAGLIANSHAMAQEEKMTQKQEIIIMKNGEVEQKTTIIVDGDHVTVNGKSLEEFEKSNPNVKILKRKKNLSFDKSNDFDVMLSPPDGSFNAPSPRTFYFRNFNGSENRKIKRAFLGVVTREAEKGAEIVDISEGSPAEKMGLQKGDIITQLAEKEVSSPESLLEAVKDQKPGEEVVISYLRNNKKKKQNVKLGETTETVSSTFSMPGMPEMNFQFNDQWPDRGDESDETPRRFFMTPGMEAPAKPRMGAKISDLEEGDGVRVIGIEPDGAGAKAGLIQEDVITEIDGRAIRNTDDAREALRKINDKNSYQITVKRGNEIKKLELKVPRKIKTANL